MYIQHSIWNQKSGFLLLLGNVLLGAGFALPRTTKVPAEVTYNQGNRQVCPGEFTERIHINHVAVQVIELS